MRESASCRKRIFFDKFMLPRFRRQAMVRDILSDNLEPLVRDTLRPGWLASLAIERAGRRGFLLPAGRKIARRTIPFLTDIK